MRNDSSRKKGRACKIAPFEGWLLGAMVRLSILVIALFLNNVCYTQQGSASAGSICGDVSRADTHLAVGSAWISIYRIATDKVKTSPLAPQKSAADGSFCFGSLPAGEFLLLPHKTGFVPAIVNSAGAVLTDVIVRSGQSSQATRLSVVPVPTVSQAPGDALRTMYTAEQRLELTFFVGTFSSSGRYLAFEIANVNTGDPEQVWRYDLVADQLLAVTAKPTYPADPHVEDIAWDGEVLYTKLNNGYGRVLFSKTDGDVTAAIPSWPADIDPLNTGSPRDIGPYSVDEQMTRGHGGGTQLFVSGKEIADLHSEGWAGIEDPPMVIVTDTRNMGIVTVDLRTLRRSVIRLPSEQVLDILAAWRAPKGLRIAYEVSGPCQPPEGLDPMMVPGNDNFQRRPNNLCVVDIPDREEPNQRLRAPAGN